MRGGPTACLGNDAFPFSEFCLTLETGQAMRWVCSRCGSTTPTTDEKVETTAATCSESWRDQSAYIRASLADTAKQLEEMRAYAAKDDAEWRKRCDELTGYDEDRDDPFEAIKDFMAAKGFTDLVEDERNLRIYDKDGCEIGEMDGFLAYDEPTPTIVLVKTTLTRARFDEVAETQRALADAIAEAANSPDGARVGNRKFRRQWGLLTDFGAHAIKVVVVAPVCAPDLPSDMRKQADDLLYLAIARDDDGCCEILNESIW